MLFENVIKNYKLMTDIIDIGIILQDPFPIGMATTNRILSYAKVLANEHNVKVYIPLQTEDEDNIINKSFSGKFEGVNFEYICKTTIWPYNVSKLKKLFILIKAIFILLNKLKKENPKTIIFYSNDRWMCCIIILVRFFINTKIFIEEDEYPKILKSNLPNLIKSFFLSVYRFADGMLVMTNELKLYYKSIKVKKVFVFPMTVDVDRFNLRDESENCDPYFAFIGGSGGFKRDGVLDSIKGFNLFHGKYDKIKFYIIGHLEENDEIYLELKEFISENNLENNVFFLGSKTSIEIPSYMKNASGLLITPPKDFISGGFPTKLGEYLASGTPVIATKVSEIPKYLNNKNAFLVDPGNIEDINVKMNLIIENPILAESVGKNGRELAESIFGAKIYIEALEQFLFKKDH